MRKAALVVTMVLAFTLTASAQTKLSGKSHCAKPDQSNQADVGDVPGHMLMLEKRTCTATTPMEIAGLKTKEDVGTSTSDMHGMKGSDSGYVTTTMDNGDKYTVHYSGTVTVKQDQTASFSGKWTVLSGTGKLKGIKGSGTYKGTAAADGSSDVDVEGEYTIEEKPAAPQKAPAKKSS